MKLYTFALFVLLVVFQTVNAESYRDLYTDTWVAADALGRQLPGHDQCGGPRDNKTVGIFYFLWLGQHGTQGPFDITKILGKNPDNPQYGPVLAPHHWGKPELDYYTSDSRYVIRKHARILSDAGVDVLIFDTTNAITYRSVYMILCEEFTKLRQAGQRTPAIMFLTHSAPDKTIAKIYNEFYAKGLYRDLWFQWKGKPLILGKPKSLPPEIQNFFHLRNCWAWTHGKDTWQWLDHYPQKYAWHEDPKKPEEVSVSTAQHATTNIGKSFSGGKQPLVNSIAVAEDTHKGLYFSQQWQRALEIDPEFIFITGWNEWVASRFINEDGKPPNNILLGKPLKPGDSFFVDAYSREYNRDIEPMEDGYGDNYYFQMVAGIRKYKGVREIPKASAPKTIKCDRKFSREWSDVEPEFRDHIGDVEHRDEQGWGAAGRLLNTTGRNDFVKMKVARDSENVYFFAETSKPVSSRKDSNWMLLFIDTDQDFRTGWNGYDYVVNLEVKDHCITSLHSLEASQWKPKKVRDIKYAVSGNRLELAIPKSALGIDRDATVKIDFHWADNIQKLGDIVEFAINGDSAPPRRFNYRYYGD